MTQVGLGVMIQSLFGGREAVDLSSVLGQEISGVSINDETLSISFKNGKKLVITDGGQSCCERRYMTTDDDLTYYVGGQLFDMELSAVEDRTGGSYDDEHQAQFLHVKTSRGSFTIENHVEHNGYYGGFYIKAQVTDV